MSNTIIKVRSLVQLPNANSHISDMSYFEVSELLTDSQSETTPIQRYASRKIKYADLNNQTMDNLLDILSQNPDQNSKGRGLVEGLNAQALSAQVYELVNGEGTADYLYHISAQTGKHTFENAPLISEKILEFDLPNNQNKSVNVKTMIDYTKVNSRIMLNSNSTFATEHYNVENMDYETLTGIEHAPVSDGDKHNVYLFRIKNFTSNTWTSPMDGWFTCYGWVDELKSTGAGNSNRWVALEGYFSDENWHVLQLCPMIPNEFCSYISFSLPINKGMKLRVTTGFKVGTNSDKYQSSPGSLTNHIANAFVGGVYGSECITSSEQ